MASEAEWSLGDYVMIGDGATPTEGFDRIPEMRVITPNWGTLEKVNVTTHDSTPPFRDRITTFAGDNTIQLEGNYLPHDTIQRAVEDLKISGTKRNFKLVVTADDGDVIYTGEAFVTAFNFTSDSADARRLSITIEPTGAWPRADAPS